MPLEVHADIWANILPFLNQYDLNRFLQTGRLIQIDKSLSNNPILKEELTQLKSWTEERANVRYINADFMIIGSECYINKDEPRQFKRSSEILRKSEPQ